MEEMEDEEEMEANDEDEEEAMMGGEMHLNQRYSISLLPIDYHTY